MLSPSAHASQVEVNKQTGAQNAAAVGTGNAVFQDLDQGSYQNQLEIGSSGYYHPQSENPSLSNQDAKQNAQLLVQAMPFSKTLTKTTFKSNLAFTTAQRFQIGFIGFLALLTKTDFPGADFQLMSINSSISLLIVSALLVLPSGIARSR